MGIITLGGIKVSPTYPKISVRIVNNTDDISTAKLNLMRIGEKFEFAEYSPTKIGVDFLEFTFDALLFDKVIGRYKARLLIEGVERTSFYLQYATNVSIEINNA